MFKNAIHMAHGQHAQHTHKYTEITKVQNVLLNFIVILLCFCYNLTNIIYLHVHCLHASRGQCLWQSRPVPVGTYEGNCLLPIFLNKMYILGNILLAYMLGGVLVLVSIVICRGVF